MTDDKANDLIRELQTLGDKFERGNNVPIVVQPDYNGQQAQQQAIQSMNSMFVSMELLISQLSEDIKLERELRILKEEKQKEIPYNPITN